MKHINFILVFLLLSSLGVTAQSIPSTDSGGPSTRNAYPPGWGPFDPTNFGYPNLSSVNDSQFLNTLGGKPSGPPPNGDMFYIGGEFLGSGAPNADWGFELKPQNEHAQATITGLVPGNTYEIEAYVARTGSLYDQSNKEQFDTPADIAEKNDHRNSELSKAGFIIDGVEYGVPLTDYEWHRVPISFTATATTATITTAAAVVPGSWTPSWSSFLRKNTAQVMHSIGANAITTTAVACDAGVDAPEF